jgi:CheY-like chemotaxis protein
MPPSPKTPLRCLVADDEPQIGSLLREALAPSGYAADVVLDGVAAARKLAEQDYALLVSDVMMPHKSGVELVRELRGHGQGIPIVLMSSFLSDETLRACGKLRHIAFLQKPFSLSDLRRAIQRAIEPPTRNP